MNINIYVNNDLCIIAKKPRIEVQGFVLNDDGDKIYVVHDELFKLKHAYMRNKNPPSVSSGDGIKPDIRESLCRFS